MHRMRRCLDPGTYPMRRRSILIRGHIRVLSAHPLAAPLAPPHLHGVALHFRLGGLRHIGDGRLVSLLISQLTTATWALTDRHRHFDGRLTTHPCIGWGLPERKAALSRLAARSLGIRFRVPLSMPRSAPRCLQFLTQLLDFPSQPIILFLRLLQLVSQVTDLCLPIPQLPSQIFVLGAFHCSLSWHGIVRMSSPFPLINYHRHPCEPVWDRELPCFRFAQTYPRQFGVREQAERRKPT